MTNAKGCRTICAMSFNIRRVEDTPKRSEKWRKLLIGALEIGKPLVGWYGLWKQRRQVQLKHQRTTVLLKRTLLVLISVLCALLLLAGTVKGLMSVQILNFGSIVSVAGADLTYDEQGYVNILLMGQGDEDHDGKDLTDTLIVASIDPKNTRSVVLLSLPRDLYFLQTEKMGKGKINSFYRDYKSYLRYREGMEPEAAGVEALRELGAEVGRKLDMEIPYVIKVNFSAFTDTVDALGGVDIDVPEDILDTEYPNESYGYETFAIAQGPQHFDGATALKYARSRHSTSDFSRSARQQQILRAIAQKAKDKGVAKDTGFLTKMAQSLSLNVETTMSLREIISLAELGRDIERDHIITMQLNDRNALYDGFVEQGGFLYTPPRSLFDGVSVLLPVSIPEFPISWRQPRTLVKLLLNTRNAYLSNPRINILNNGAKSGSARKLAVELIRYGFTVDTIANATLPQEQEKSMVFQTSEEEENTLALFFASLLHMELAAKPDALPFGEVADITIILGKDYSYAPLQNLLAPSS